MPKLSVVAVSVALMLVPRPARAQLFESVGIRAQGTGGAFVAIADDATATWWNPAGLATGAYFNLVVEYDRRPDPQPESPVSGVAVAFPALGLSYYRLPINQMRAPASTGSGAVGRQDEGVLSVYGATFGQSIGKHLVLASTLKLQHLHDTQGDIDIGAMANLGHLRLGVVVKNVRETRFDSDGGPIALDREARAGVAFLARSSGWIGTLTLAADADLTTTTTALGNVQHVAGGAEVALLHDVIGVRAGASQNTLEGGGSSRSAGLSVGLYKGRYLRAYVEGQATGGSDLTRRGWSVGLRATF